jgi:hypothetical protein
VDGFHRHHVVVDQQCLRRRQRIKSLLSLITDVQIGTKLQPENVLANPGQMDLGSVGAAVDLESAARIVFSSPTRHLARELAFAHAGWPVQNQEVATFRAQLFDDLPQDLLAPYKLDAERWDVTAKTR